tara:strand:- start:64 stop:510 length:447 start_codon:yes stop_codon:yes gene_type:complete
MDKFLPPEDAEHIGEEHPSLPGYILKQKDRYHSYYEKWDSLAMVGSYLQFDHFSREIIAGKVLSKKIADTRVAMNKQIQNDFDGYRGKELIQEYAVPEMMMQQLKEESGLDHVTGEYDEKKAKAILDDPDYRYLKTVPGKISGRKRQI